MSTISVVTGANSGIGRATAIHLASQGHDVFGTVRSRDKAGKLQAMSAEAGVEINLVELDVADDESVRARLRRDPRRRPTAWSTCSSTTRASAATLSPRSARRRCTST